MYSFTNIVPALNELSRSAITLTGTACVLFTLVLVQLRSWYRLKHVPGPFLNSMSIMPMARMAASGKLCFLQRDLCVKYGPLVRVGPNEVLFGDANTFRRITGARSAYTKSPWYQGVRPIPEQDSIVSMINESQRRELRTKLTPGYSGKEGSDFEAGVDKYTAILVDLIERKYLSTPQEYKPIEFSHKAQFFALDVITELGFGEAFGFLTNDQDMYRYVEINDSFLPALVVLLELPWVNLLLQTWPFNKIFPTSADDYGFGRLMGLGTKIVDERLKPGAEPGNDMMESHIRSGMKRSELLAEVFNKILAGSDSTAMAIRMMLLFLVTTPPALTALRNEIDAAVSIGRVSSPIKDKEALALPYLQAVIRETLRMYPPITGHNYKLVPKGGDTVCGYFLPEGTQVALCHVYVLRNQETFGADAEIFRPGRWLEALAEDESRYKEMCSTVDLVFAHGKYYCLGKTLAWMELNKVVVELVRRFDFALVDPVNPIKLRDCAFWVGQDFWLHVTARAAGK